MVSRLFKKEKTPEFRMNFSANLQPFGMSKPPTRGTAELLKSYSTNPAIHQVVGRIGTSVRSMRWRMYVARNPKTKKSYRHIGLQNAAPAVQGQMLKSMLATGDVEELTGHIALDTLQRGNTNMVGFEVWELVQIWCDLVGEALLYKERDALGVPTCLWPISPLWIKDIPRYDSPYFVVHIGNSEIKIPETECIYFRNACPHDPYGRGAAAGHALAREIETIEHIGEHVKASFYNNLRPDTIISSDGLSPEATARLEADWRIRFKNIWERYKPYFISRAVQVHQLNRGIAESQTIEMMRTMASVIREVYGCPPEIFGIVENSNRATIQTAENIMGRYVLDPRKDFQRQHLQRSLLPDYDERLILGFDTAVSSDYDFVLDVAKTAPWSRTMDEWRALQDLPPVENGKGNVYCIDWNKRVVDQIAPDDEPAKAAPAKPKADGEKHVTLAAQPVDAVMKELTDADIDRVCAAVKAETLTDDMLPILRDVIAHFGARMYMDVDGPNEFNVTDPNILKFLKQNATARIEKITNETTRARLKSALVEGRDAGEVGFQLSKRIESVFEEASGVRARTIARTEVGMANNFAHMTALNQADIEEKEWWAAMDERTRGSHSGLHGTHKKRGDYFTTSNGSALHPMGFGVGSEDINCRCTLNAYFPDDKKGLTDSQKDTWQKSVERDRQQFERRAHIVAKKAFAKQQQQALDALNEKGA